MKDRATGLSSAMTGLAPRDTGLLQASYSNLTRRISLSHGEHLKRKRERGKDPLPEVVLPVEGGVRRRHAKVRWSTTSKQLATDEQAKNEARRIGRMR